MPTLGAVVLALLIAELLGWLRPIADWVAERGSHRLADPQARERYAAEWKAELDSLDGRRLTQLLTAVWMFHRAAGMNVALGHAAPRNRRPAVECLSGRVLNVSVAAASLVVVAPVLCIVAVAVKLTSPGPVLVRRRTTGRDGRTYNSLKFRTLMTGSGAHPDLPEDLRSLIFVPRLTNIGHILRAASLDESPELWNVLRGNTLLVSGDGEPGSPDGSL